MMHAKLNNYVYSSRIEILNEITRRRNDPELRKKVDDFFGDSLPNFLGSCDQPFAFLSRPIITPNMEMHNFIDINSSFFGLKPLFLEYPGKFVARNNDKYHLAKLRFFDTKNLAERLKVVTITDFNHWEGREFREVKTTWGEPVCALHRRLFLTEYPEYKNNIFDITHWFDKVREEYAEYYFGFYSLALIYGVLFENYLFDVPDEVTFFNEKALPSFAAVEDYFGVKPLIYPILSSKDANDDKWLHYPARLINELGS